MSLRTGDDQLRYMTIRRTWGIDVVLDFARAGRAIGKPVRRREYARLLTGGGRFADDTNLPGQGYACMVRSPHAHALIANIDTGPAEGMPGVIAVLTGSDAGVPAKKRIDIIVTTALSAQTEPTDRSMPPLMMTKVSPSDIKAMKLKFFEMLRRLRGVMKTGARIQITIIRATKATTT